MRAQAPAVRSIRDVDFRNFTYEPACAQGRVTVAAGRFDRDDPDETIHFSVKRIAYGAGAGGSEEIAVVLTGCNLDGIGYWTEAPVFAVRNGAPTHVTTLGEGDRAGGGIASVAIKGDTLTVAQQFGVALCCADFIESTKYRVQGSALIPVGRSDG